MAREQGRPATGPGVTGEGHRGFLHTLSRSVRPKKNPLPLDLDNHGRLHSWSTGTPHGVSAAPPKNGGPPNLGPVPRGYVHNESNYTPTVRNMNGDRLKKGKD